MMGALTAWTDRLLGRGEASITVPVFDGALKSNRLIEDAQTLATLEAPMDLATDGQSVFLADGRRVWQHDGASATWAAREVGLDSAGSVPAPGQTITALACLPGGGLALALDGKAIQIVGGPHAGRRFDNVAGRPLMAANAIAATEDDKLIVTDGSGSQPFERWKHDLMELGRSGRVLEFNLGDGSGRVLASKMAHAFGVCATPEGAWACESWRHRVLRLGTGQGAATGTPDRML